MKRLILLILFPLIFVTLGFSEGEKSSKMDYNPDLNYAQVVYVKAILGKGDVWYFEVTVRHNDEGWNHYANSWEIVNADNGKVIAERVLAHPHTNEQPFTRSLGGIKIPEEVSRVFIRAKCNLHGFGGKTVLLDLGKSKGEDYSIERY